MRNGFLHLLTPPSHTWQKKCSRNRTCDHTAVIFIYGLGVWGERVCGILFFGVDTWPKRHSPRTRKKIYIRLSKIERWKETIRFPRKDIGMPPPPRNGVRGVGTYDKHLTFFYFTLSSRNDSPNDPAFFSCSHCILYILEDRSVGIDFRESERCP